MPLAAIGSFQCRLRCFYIEQNKLAFIFNSLEVLLECLLAADNPLKVKLFNLASQVK